MPYPPPPWLVMVRDVFGPEDEYNEYGSVSLLDSEPPLIEPIDGVEVDGLSSIVLHRIWRWEVPMQEVPDRAVAHEIRFHFYGVYSAIEVVTDVTWKPDVHVQFYEVNDRDVQLLLRLSRFLAIAPAVPLE